MGEEADALEKKKAHRERHSGRKADKKKAKNVQVQELTAKQRNPKAFTFNSAVRAERRFRRTQDIETKRQHIPLVDRTPLEPPPVIVGVVGPPKVGKTTLIQCLIRNFTRQPLTSLKGPVTLVSGKKRRITLMECNNDINSMIDIAKVADLVLLLIDASFGFEMEIFEFLNICQVHGMPRVMGVLTHLDMLKNSKQLKKTKKTLKHRFWTEVYAGAKLFYLSGMLHDEYMRNEVKNLARFISVIKFRPLTWRTSHPYILADRMEDLTPPELIRQNPKIDRLVSLYGYVRGMALNKTSSIHIPGCGDLKIHDVSHLPDPCPLPDKMKKRVLVEKERLVYAPFSGVGGIVYDKDAVYVELGGSHSHKFRDDDGPEKALVSTLRDTQETLDMKMARSELQLFSGTAPILSEDVNRENGLIENVITDTGRIRRRVLEPGRSSANEESHEGDSDSENSDDDDEEFDDDDEDFDDEDDDGTAADSEDGDISNSVSKSQPHKSKAASDEESDDDEQVSKKEAKKVKKKKKKKKIADNDYSDSDSDIGNMTSEILDTSKGRKKLKIDNSLSEVDVSENIMASSEKKKKKKMKNLETEEDLDNGTRTEMNESKKVKKKKKIEDKEDLDSENDVGNVTSEILDTSRERKKKLKINNSMSEVDSISEKTVGSSEKKKKKKSKNLETEEDLDNGTEMNESKEVKKKKKIVDKEDLDSDNDVGNETFEILNTSKERKKKLKIDNSMSEMENISEKTVSSSEKKKKKKSKNLETEEDSDNETTTEMNVSKKGNTKKKKIKLEDKDDGDKESDEYKKHEASKDDSVKSRLSGGDSCQWSAERKEKRKKPESAVAAAESKLLDILAADSDEFEKDYEEDEDKEVAEVPVKKRRLSEENQEVEINSKKYRGIGSEQDQAIHSKISSVLTKLEMKPEIKSESDSEGSDYEHNNKPAFEFAQFSSDEDSSDEGDEEMKTDVQKVDDDDDDWKRDADMEGSEEEGQVESAVRWKSNLALKAADAFLERQATSQNLWKLVYGDLKHRPAETQENTTKAEENDSDEGEGIGGLFKLKREQQQQQEQKDLMNVEDCAKFVVNQVREWTDSDVREIIRDCFVTGKWKESEDAEELLRLDNDDDDDEDLFGDFEDLETGEKHMQDKQDKKESTDTTGEVAAEDSKNLTREQLQEKKRKLKEKFDAEYDDKEGGKSYYDELKQEVDQQAQLNKNEFEGLDDAFRVQLEGYRPGMYVRVEVANVPCELITNFDPTYPLIVGGLISGEENIGFVQVRIKKHRWSKKILKTRDPVIISLGWRRFQTLPIYSKLEDNLRHTMLKYTPEHVTCMAHFWGPITPQTTGFLAVQDVANQQVNFRIAATGSVVELDKSTQIMKKLKLIGTPYKIYKKTAFIQGMFNSTLEVAKFEGAKLKTVSGIRGQIKKAVGKPEGAFRATFEDKLLLSDIVFCRTWYRVDVPKLYNPVTSLLLPPTQKNEWRGMKTVGQLKREKGIRNQAEVDSLYTPIEREPKVFQPLVIPRSLQKQLPYKDKPKNPAKFDKRKALESGRIAVVRDPYERKVASLMKMLKTSYGHKQEQLKQATKQRIREHRKVKEQEEMMKMKREKVLRKQVFRTLSKMEAKKNKSKKR